MSLEGASQSNRVEDGSESPVDTNDDESLLVLVMPELISLSRYWLAALKDHALLSLPPGEFNLKSIYSIVFICWNWMGLRDEVFSIEIM